MKLSIIILYFKKVIGKVLYHLRKILKVLSYTAITIVLVDLLVFLMTEKVHKRTKSTLKSLKKSCVKLCIYLCKMFFTN